MTSPVRDSEPRPIHDRAIQDLSFIRRTMEGAASFTGVPGWGLVAVGVTAVVAALVARNQDIAGNWLLVWLSEAVLAVSLSALFLWLKARRMAGAGRRPALGIPGRKFLLGFWPAIMAGAVLTFSLVDVRTAFTAEAAVPRILPGLWLLLYGVAVVTAGMHSVRAVPAMGIGFMALGALALFVPALSGDLMLGIGFGGLQMAFGVAIARRHGG